MREPFRALVAIKFILTPIILDHTLIAVAFHEVYEAGLPCLFYCVPDVMIFAEEFAEEVVLVHCAVTQKTQDCSDSVVVVRTDI